MSRKILSSNLTVRIVSGVLLILIISSNLNAKTIDTRVRLAGLVVDAATLSPLAAANIYSSDKKLLGTTDKNGYYSVNIDCNTKGPIRFSIAISKNGFETLSDRENWGDLQNNTKMIIYFGMKENKSNAEQFSKFAGEAGNLSYNNVLSAFSKYDYPKPEKFEDFENLYSHD